MIRLARVVAPGGPHHVTQRGNRRKRTLFTDDYRFYGTLMWEWCARSVVEIWAYCLMPNHVHLNATPETAQGLRCGIGEAHRHYARHVNFREGWRGFLWQGRFASFPLYGDHLLAAAWTTTPSSSDWKPAWDAPSAPANPAPSHLKTQSSR